MLIPSLRVGATTLRQCSGLQRFRVAPVTWRQARPLFSSSPRLQEAPGGPSLDAPRPKPRVTTKKAGGPTSGMIYLGGVCVFGAAYVASEDVQNGVHGLPDRFEEFNDSSREFFESIGDRMVGKTSQEPWLLDLAEMKYPDNIPTLVLDVDKVILQLAHDSKTGWHVVKRPFADQFFKEIGHYYEVVLFSDDVFPVAVDIAQKWNLPVTGVLHREFCKKKRNHYVKDLSKLGRDLKRVVMIDHDPEAFSLQPENGILIKPFTGDMNDGELMDLLDFLKACSAEANKNQDVRQYIQKFGGGDEDLGRRYLVHKREQDAKIENRRGLGRAFSSRTGSMSMGPGGPGGGAFGQPQFR